MRALLEEGENRPQTRELFMAGAHQHVDRVLSLKHDFFIK